MGIPCLTSKQLQKLTGMDPLLKRNATIVTAGSVLNALLGIIFQVLLARWLGLDAAASAYSLATMVPTLVATVLIGTLPSILVPIFVRQRNGTDDEPVQIKQLRTIFGAVILSTGLLILGSLFVASIAPPSTLGGDASLFRLYAIACALTIPLAAIAAVCQANLMAANRFTAVGFAGAVNGLGVLIPTVIVVSVEGSPTILAVSFVAGYILQALLTGYASRKYWTRAPLRKTNETFSKAALIMIGATLVYKSQPIIERTLAAPFEGGPAVIAYADKIAQGVLLGSTLGIALVSLPAVSSLVSNGQMRGAYEKSADLSIVVAVFAVPFVAAGIFSAPHVVSLLYRGGSFSDSDVTATVMVLQISLIGVGFSAISGPIVNLLYASSMLRVVSVISIATTLAGVIISLIMRQNLGLRGVVWGASLMLIANFAIFLWIATKKYNGNASQYLTRLVAIVVPAMIAGWLTSKLIQTPSIAGSLQNLMAASTTFTMTGAVGALIWAVVRRKDARALLNSR